MSADDPIARLRAAVAKVTPPPFESFDWWVGGLSPTDVLTMREAMTEAADRLVALEAEVVELRSFSGEPVTLADLKASIERRRAERAAGDGTEEQP